MCGCDYAFELNGLLCLHVMNLHLLLGHRHVLANLLQHLVGALWV